MNSDPQFTTPSTRSVRPYAFLTALCCVAFAVMSLHAGAADAPATETFSSAFVATPDGARIHYLHGGKPSAAPAVVFIPGWTWSAPVWKAQMTPLAPSRAVVAMDPRSQGDSSMTADGNTPEGRAQDLAALLQQLGDAPVVLVGWSQGVQDVAAYIDKFGTARLAGIVLVDSALSAGPASFEADPAGTRQLLERIAIYAEYPKEYLAGMLDASRTTPFTAAEKARLVAMKRKTPTSTGISMLVTDLLTTDRRGVVAKIDKPTLLIAAASSGELAAQKKMADDIPGAKLKVIDNAGHAVFLDQPEEFSKALTEFLDGLQPGRP
jgi:pimeloyl-ACP methyl ester carboxylesterase